ncbi:MAG: bifunctional folylpolyglutamate synthase/dihydrofolate synthase [Polyangiaceae bacterium]|nr:bifunctional folylpolyglutamate synthase/dihydrofolate synthase [Polyangiaceae bacterium]MCW5791419.1 bifunctional folylpolyglutamate synthase/dihydrofolate synthase [Polyangiaceae bacterium]
MSELKRTLERLYSRVPLGTRLGLERVEAVCRYFGDPQAKFEAVHVAGTNGKGSVCAFVASTLRTSGKKVGLYTSPHLSRFAERIQIDGEPISDELLVELLTEVLDAGPELTFFEVSTVAAFLAFARAGVDIAVVEVGLGGRLDATNVLPPPRVAAITRIAFDHMDLLGDSLSAIAREKAAIIKSGSKVVVGRLHPDARAEVEQRVAEVGAELLELGPAEPLPGARIAYPRLAMFGTNLAVANTIARTLGVDTDALLDGIESTQWPGRNELLHRGNQDLTLLDCAHNPDATVALSHVLDPSALGEIESRREVALVFGAVKRKNWRAMMRRLEQVAGHRVFVAPPVPDAVDPNEIAAHFSGQVAGTVGEALTLARSAVGSRGVVVVTGSTYLVGAARSMLLGLPSDPPVES